MKTLIQAFLLLLVCTNSYAQPTLAWSQDYPAAATNYYSGGPQITAENETLKVIGKKNTPQGQRLAIINYSLQGATISSILLGNGSTNNTIIDYKFDANHQTYLLMSEKTGYYKSKLILQKYAPDNSLIWTAQIQDAAAVSYLPYSIGLGNDNCIFINAYKETNYPVAPTDQYETVSIPMLYAFNQNGSLLWQREFNPNTEIDIFGNKILVYNQTAYLLGYNYNLVKVDTANNLTVNNTIGLYSGINDVILTTDNKLLVTAVTGKYKFTRLDLNGASDQLREYNTFIPSNVLADEIKAITQDTDGNIYVTGRHYGHNYGMSTYTNADLLTVKYSPNGTLLWENRYQYLINNADIGNSITLKNGFVYVGGSSERQGVPSDYDYVTLKIDEATGQTNQVYRYNGLANGDDSVTSMTVLDNGDYALTGLSYKNGLYDWTTQFFSDDLSVPKNETLKPTEISPNPVASGKFLTINGSRYDSYKLVSALGQFVQSGSLAHGDGQRILIQNLRAGMYVLQLQNGSETSHRKIIIQ